MQRRNRASAKPKTRDLAPARRKPQKRVAGKLITYPKGKPIRVSSATHAYLERKLRNGESFDKLLRRLFNLPARDGTPAGLLELWFLPSTGQTAPTEEKAKGISLKNGCLKGKEKFERPIRLREVI